MDGFERELKQALERRPAPPSLKRRLMEKRASLATQRRHSRVVWWERIAASIVLCGAIGGAVEWHHVEEVRRGEAARDQVLTALRITNHALNEVNLRLTSRSRTEKE
ncbi:MAG TPA: hypothetical protein VMU48_15490 [Terracidiphilus sp.]|nr:hypothetical protein [Terracidiphilus sp.]